MSRPPGPPPYTFEQLAQLSTPRERFVATAELTSYIVGHRLAEERERGLRHSPTMSATTPNSGDYHSTSHSSRADSTSSHNALKYHSEVDNGNARSTWGRGSGPDRRTARNHGGYQPYPTTSEARAKMTNRRANSGSATSRIGRSPFDNSSFEAFHRGDRYSPRESTEATKSTSLCPRFTTTGKCARMGCPDVHDPDKLAICKNWLYTSQCDKGYHCDLSHTPSPHNKPHCLYHLQGRCTKSPCIFAHAEIALATDVCDGFGRLGYCNDGASCAKLHVYECPDFANQGACSAGEHCLLKHIQRASRMKARHGSSAVGALQDSSYIARTDNAEGVNSSDELHAITQQHNYIPFDSAAN